MQKVVLLERFSHTLCKNPSILTFRGGGRSGYFGVKSYCSARIADLTVANKKRKLVVLGTGWGGAYFLKDLKTTSFDVEVISTQNYFALNPLLPCVACGTLQARSVAEPIRNIIRKKNVDMQLCEAECTKIDAENHRVHCRPNLKNNSISREEFVIDYDYLVIAVGARSNTFNIPGVSENCLFLKNLGDAEKIRSTILGCFERASLPNLSEEERKRILHFVVIGGGPTGVELAGQLHDFIEKDLVRLYPHVKDLAKVTLLEAADHVLNMFNQKVRAATVKKFQRDGIDVKTGATVVKISDKDISVRDAISGEITSMPYGMAIWSTGIETRPVIKDFVKQIGQGDRPAVVTDEWLRVEGYDSIYAFGDCATVSPRRITEDISAIFRKADSDQSGTISDKEFQEVFSDMSKRYPQVELYLKAKKIPNPVDLLKVSNGDAGKISAELDIEEFKSALFEADSYIKRLPATGQVAAQQGAYLADCFNRMEECTKNPEGPLRFGEGGHYPFQPFRYNHQGLLVSLGGEKSGLQFPGGQEMVGRTAQSLWYFTYTSKLVSWRTRIRVLSEWTRRFLFGRDPNCV